jgi:hypothetical protein
VRKLAVLVTVALASRLAAPAQGNENSRPFADIQGLLDVRAEAMRSGDREAFLATVDRGSPVLLRRQNLLFDGFQRLGLSEYRLDISLRLWPELTTSRDVARYGASAQPTVLHVEERYSLGPYDEQPALEDQFLTFVQRPGGWRIASDTDLDDLTLFSGRKLWEFEPVVARESEHFLYVSHRSLLGAATTVLKAAEEALDSVAEEWPLAWSEKVVILAPSTTAELGRLIQATFDLDVFVAFAASGVDRTRDWDLVGHRILFNWPTFSLYDEATRRSVLTHELLHIATREYSGPLVPIFVEEGVAEWITGHDSSTVLAGRVQNGLFDRLLPLDHEFISGSDAVILSAYQESSAAVRYAAEQFGQEAIARFYRELGSERRSSGTWRYHVDRAMRAAFGIGYEEFQRRWAKWVENTLD